MIHRLALLLTSLLVLGFAAAGCGDDDKKDSGGGGNPPAEKPSEGTNGNGGVSAKNPQVKQAVQNCKQSIAAQPRLSSGVKSDLNDICEKAAKGDEGAVRKATKEVCTKIVEETAPAGAARDQALMACDQATQTPTR
jgi:hypothetical protein